MERLQIIENIIQKSPNRLREKYFIKYANDTYLEIINFTKKIQDIEFKWKVWHWVNDKPDYVLCRCGSKCSPKISWKDGYRNFCSVKCASNDESVRIKAQETLLNKYGVDHYSKTETYKEQVKKTSIERYGVDNYSKTDEYISKAKQAYIQKYGVENYTKTEEYKLKSRETSLKKWGVTSFMKTEECKRKIKISLSKRVGSEMIFQDEEYRKSNFNICNDEFYIRYLGESQNEFRCDFDLDHNFIITTDNYFGRKKAGNKLCTICNPISKSSSLKEDMLHDFISKNYDGQIIRHYRDKYEIDVYLPELNIGFEFNGLWWHSDEYKDANSHLRKTEYFQSKDIRIIHIWEDDWVTKNMIIKSQISNLIKVNQQKIYARNCSIELIDTKRAKEFLNKNHIQGFVQSVLKIGLFYQDELVSLMTFDHFEGRKKMTDSEWNLNRFCTKLNFNIVGGASKILNYFKKNYKPTRIISYADRDWSRGNLYYKLGFNLIGVTKPDYKYLIDGRRLHKSRFRKSRLKCTISESKYMQSKSISRIYDCGKMKFEQIINIS
jgi:hypothetical protein